MLRTNVARFAVLAAFAIIFVACDPPAPPSPSGASVPGPSASGPVESGAPPQAAPEDLKLIAPGKLTIGYASNPVNIECETSSGPCVGRLAYLIGLAAERMGLEPVYEPYAFAALVPALQSHRIDVLVAGFSVTQARANVLYQGPPQYMGLDTLITKKGEQIATYEEAAERGLILASVRGYLQLGNWEALGIETHTWDNTDACVEDVLQGGAYGCAVGSLYYALQTVQNPTGRTVAELWQNEIRGPLVTADLSSSFTVAKDRPELARALNAQVRTLWRDGSAEAGWEAIGLQPADYGIFLQIPETNYYIPGPWEEGVVPPASEAFAPVTTIEPGVLTVGVVDDSPLLTLSGESGSGPEADIMAYAAERLGLSTKYVRITDEAAALGADVDVVAGQLATTRERTLAYWMTQPIGFNPDYIYVAPDPTSGALPEAGNWEALVAAGGTIGVTTGSDRAADLVAAGITPQEFPDAAAGFRAVAAGEVTGFVASTVDFASAVAADPTIQSIGFIRNLNGYTAGEAFGWGVQKGNAQLVDALDQAITLAWQQRAVLGAYGTAWPGADVTALAAPGPTAVGAGGVTKDYRAQGMLISGPWLQYQSFAE